MITPEQLREWAQDADDGEDVVLGGDVLREIAWRLDVAKVCSQHPCPEWDFEEIDCTMDEFDACLCWH